MSYPRDLDEYLDEELRQELRRREKNRRRGQCDYCGRKSDEPPCKFPVRHWLTRKAFANGGKAP